MYVPSAKKTYRSQDVVFDYNFISPLSIPDLQFQGGLRIQGANTHIPHTYTLTETTSLPTSKSVVYPEAFIKKLSTPEVITENNLQSSLLIYERVNLRERILINVYGVR